MKDILIIEDSPEMKILLEASLNDEMLTFASTLKEGKAWIEKKNFHLILLDLGLPDGDGLKFLTELQASKQFRDIPILILSGRTDTPNKVIAFSMGAEDFISKPFDPIELKARVQARLKKLEKSKEKLDVLRLGDLQIEVAKQKVSIQVSGGYESVDLTSLEFRLLLTLSRHPERIYSRDTLLNEVWGHQISVTDRTVDTHIGHLRKKIAKSKTQIETVIGSGYRIKFAA